MGKMEDTMLSHSPNFNLYCRSNVLNAVHLMQDFSFVL